MINPITLLLIPVVLNDAFTPPRSTTKTVALHYQTFSETAYAQCKPSWVPMELIEFLASEQHLTSEEFIVQYVDGEAFTSCDDEGDGLHECDFFGQYLGPTKWLHLTPLAHKAVDQIHFTIWEDAWKNPHSSVDVADKVSKEVMSYYTKHLQQDEDSSITSPSKPQVRIKVIPASFGLEGFEDAIWEATQEILPHSMSEETGDISLSSFVNDKDQAITFVVASPDLSDPILTEHECKTSSPQAEFASDKFEAFVDTLQDKLELFSRLEGIPIDDAISVRAFHPLWNEKFPYPCVAVSN